VRFNEAGSSLRGAELVEFVRDRKKVITALEPIDEAFLKEAPQVSVISKYGVGTDMLDLRAMARHGVRLGWTAGVNKRSVAELALAFMIALLHDLPALSLEVREGVWRNRTVGQLSGRVVGIVGCGNVGKDLSKILRALGCTVLAHDIADFPLFYAESGVRPVGLEELLRSADVVSLHLPLDDTTRNMLHAGRLEMLKPGALLINTARGGLVDEVALKVMLSDGRIAGAAFDVFAVEPPVDMDLLGLPNFLATPHIGGSSTEAILAMGRAAIEGLDRNQLPSDGWPPCASDEVG
jgi:phosphoglycerate dehydrogenase-like enzyme